MPPDPKNPQYEMVCKLWDDAKSFKEICLLNQRFLRGELSCTPYQAGPVLEESGQALQDLFRLHDRGVLTICSNVYQHSVEFDGANSEWTEWQQRPSLDFITPGNSQFAYTELLRELRANPHLRVLAWRDSDMKAMKGSNLDMSVVMRSRGAKTKEGLASAEWKTISSAGTIDDNELREFQPYDLAVVSDTDPVQWQVLMVEWDEEKATRGGNLNAVVLDAVVKCVESRLS